MGYVKKNAIAGHRFPSWEALEAHLARWQREVAEVRIHGTTGEAPRARFERDERRALAPLDGRPSFLQVREYVRIVNAEACVEIDTNRYWVPWRLIGEAVTVRIEGDALLISHAGRIVAQHAVLSGKRARSVDAAHFDGLVGRMWRSQAMPDPKDTAAAARTSELARSLTEYEALVGGGF